MKSVSLINPNLVVQRNDPFTTGIVYMPIGLAYTAAILRQAGYAVNVIDAYAESPECGYRQGKFTIFGFREEEVVEKIPVDTVAICVYAINLTNHIAAINIVRALKQKMNHVPVIILENTQAVTAYSLRQVMDTFLAVGAEYIITGEPEQRLLSLLKKLHLKKTDDALKEIDGLGTANFYSPPSTFIEDLDLLPFPAWDLFPLQKYWRLRFAHGPQSSPRYLPLLTSRGCPYACRFCVVPATNQQRWRPRSAINVVDEMEYYVSKFQVHEFHIEDLDPSISDQRMRDISEEILRRDLNIVWKIVAGTKVETIRDESTIDLMAKSGCRYLSISPETGSTRVLKLMKKPFDLEHAIKMVRKMNRVGIKSQACFVLGFPGEEEDDIIKTWNLVHDLTKEGVDEIALFIITPVPGSSIFDDLKGYHSLSEMNFSPTWREDYQTLSRFRLRLYVHFLLWKLRYHPIKILKQPIHFLFRRYETKMEMVPYRAFRLSWFDLKNTRGIVANK